MSIYCQQYARPYATAAFEWAQAAAQESQWQALFDGLATVFADEKLKAVLFDPRLGEARLADIIIQILAANINQSQQNFLKYLAKQRRLALLPTIAQLFQQLVAVANHCVVAIVSSAFALSDHDQQRLIDKLSSKYNKRVQLQCLIEPNLLGGLRIKMGDEVIDASIRGKLAQLTVQLASH